MHLNEWELQMLAEPGCAGPAAGDETVARHLQTCADCSRALALLRVERARHAALLQLLDDSPAPADVEAVIARATRRRARRAHTARLAAGITLLIASGAAAAMSASPVGRYWREVRGVDAARKPQAPLMAARRPASPAPTQAGVAFTAGARIRVLFRDVQPAGVVRVVIDTVALIRLTHHGGSAAYALAVGGIDVDNEGSSASFDLVLPGTVTDAVVRVGTRTVLRKHGSHVRAVVGPESSGVYVIPLSPTHTPTRRFP